jgi:hypothetical protein
MECCIPLLLWYASQPVGGALQNVRLAARARALRAGPGQKPEAESLSVVQQESSRRSFRSSGIATVFQVARSILFALFKDLSPSNKQYEVDVKSIVMSSPDACLLSLSEQRSKMVAQIHLIRLRQRRRRLEPTSKLAFPIQCPANYGRPSKSRPPMSHRKTDFGILCVPQNLPK